jgi:hypothetical protein
MYKNIKVKRADVVAKHITGTRKKRKVKTYINGQVYVLTFNKEFKSKVQVMHKYTDYIPKEKNAEGERVPRPKVEMENTDFNSVFKVYANNDIEAFYLLTPQIMETMIDACAIKKSVVNFAFTKNKLVINFNTNSDSLRIPFDKMGKEDRDEMLKEARREMEFIVRLIDIFNLENDIFKTEGGFLS